MKIELTCQHCESILRVGVEHAGKHLRCPNCQNLSIIPGHAPVELVEPTGENSKFSAPVDDFTQPAPAYINPTTPRESRQEVLSLIFGIVGILMNFSCLCVVPIFLILNFFGLFWAFQSTGSLRLAGILTNAFALLVATGKILLSIFSFGLL